ncbi:hypothetical protein PVBG_04842 [Plasmodium vivax Brazil I]|uniref:Uncharacterized protein n=1 Tax=Plasmodium vivax (strain Brazil I) TaxID=1033975 RepID=A0A0J9SXC4_PLAV1|nr:hypothetical protein PVBG_04842 [Plasmodium vivax Brazil I]
MGIFLMFRKQEMRKITPHAEAKGMEHLIFYRKNRKKNASKGKIKVKARVLFRDKVKACLK